MQVYTMEEDEVEFYEYTYLSLGIFLWVVMILATKKRIFAHFFNLFAKLYNKRMGERKKVLFESLNQVKTAHGDEKIKILEVGCGAGANFAYFPHGCEVICVEPNRHFEKIVRKKLRQVPEISLAKFHVGVAENMKRLVETESVDVVVITLVLCTVKDPVRSLQEIIRVLKPVSTDIVNVKLRNSCMSKVVTNVENLEETGNFTLVRKKLGKLGKVRELVVCL